MFGPNDSTRYTVVKTKCCISTQAPRHVRHGGGRLMIWACFSIHRTWANIQSWNKPWAHLKTKVFWSDMWGYLCSSWSLVITGSLKGTLIPNSYKFPSCTLRWFKYGGGILWELCIKGLLQISMNWSNAVKNSGSTIISKWTRLIKS